jgi:hypothetical protein
MSEPQELSLLCRTNVKKFYIAEGPKLNFDCSNLDTSIENMAEGGLRNNWL